MKRIKYQFHTALLRCGVIVLIGIFIMLFPAHNSYAAGADYGTVSLKRIYGVDRYETAEKTADELLSATGRTSFDSIVIASGQNFPDALSESYLAKCCDAPILLVSPQTEKKVADYTSAHLNTSGTIYLLGGSTVVSESFSALMASERPDAIIERKYGIDRYSTNLEVLRSTGVTGGTIMVAAGSTFADGMCASSSGYPVLLVGSKLTREQLAFLDSLTDPEFVIVGGAGAVSTYVEETLSQYGVTTRVWGSTRYSTSAAFAEWSKGQDVSGAVIVSGNDFPDALVSGSIAVAEGKPILLASNSSDISTANKYIVDHNITDVTIFGGDTLVSDVVADLVWEGVDVSEFQDVIDWKSARDSGVKFAMVRLGGRSGESGKLYTDKFAAANLQGAKAQGDKSRRIFFHTGHNGTGSHRGSGLRGQYT